MAYNAGEARLSVVPDASGFKAKTEAALAKIQVDFAAQVGADTTRAAQELAAFRAREAANAVNLRVDVDTAGARAQIAALRSASGGLGQFGGGALPLNAALLGLNLVPGAALGITQLAGALQQLAQAAFVVPGAIGGAVASIGTLAVGVSGVKDAYDAVTKAAEDSGQSQAQQARAASAAQNAHRNAAVDNAQAHEDLARAFRDARQEITDLNIEINGGVISEKQAINDAKQARKDLATGRFQDALDLEAAQLRVQAADQRVVEARQRNIDLQERASEANAKGISGSDQVVAAQERVVRSEQALADATANMAAVAQQGSLLQQKAAEEMAKLAPNAREFVDALRDTQSARDQLRAASQQPLFAGLAGELRELTDGLLPSLSTGMGNVAVALNQNIRQLMQSVGSDNSRGLLDRIMGNTADAQGRFTRAIDPLVSGIGTLVAAGSDALPRIAGGIADVSERFAAFIETADQDGRLDRWINEGIDGFTDLGNILLNLGDSITAITRAAGGPGLLSTLNDVTGRMATFLNSTQGQQQLRDFFNQARQDLENWRPILESLPGLFHGLMDAARQWAAIIIPPLSEISSFLAEHPGLIAAVVTAFAAWKTIAGVASLIESLTKINNLLGSGGGRGGKGGRGILGKLALISIGGIALDQLLDDNGVADPASPPPSAGQSAGNFFSDVASGAVTGGVVAGVPGAIVGGGVGAGNAVVDRVTGDFQRGQQRTNELHNEWYRTHPYQPPTVSGPSVGEELRSKIAAGQLPGFSLSAEGLIIGPDGKPISNPALPGFIGPHMTGGPTPSGRGPGPTGGWMAEVHDDEWILPKHARQSFPGGDRALWALTEGRRFQGGGYVDQFGNPITPGAAPGPAAGAAIAPNPYQGGGVPGILGSFVSGIQGPIGNALSVGSSVLGAVQGPAVDPGLQTQHGLGITPPGPAAAPSTFADRMATVPGLWGLVGSAASSNPMQNMLAWGQETASWLGQWASNTLTGFGSALWQGTLGVFGLENSILSPNNPWNQAGQQAGQFFLAQDGPLGALTGSSGQSGAAPEFGQQLLQLGDGSTVAIPTFGTAIPGVAAPSAATPGGALPLASPGTLTSLPTRLGKEGGLQVNTINVKRAIEAAFPQIQTIGGYRKDALKWHPNGLAIDVMIPGGTTRGGANPAGKALGDRIWAWLQTNGPAMGVLLDASLWQTDTGGDHYDHLHIATSGGGYPNGQSAPAGAGPAAPSAPAAGGSSFYSSWYPKMAAGGAVRGPGGPKSDVIPALLSNDEHVFTADDVNAMGGQPAVYAFRRGLHGYANGGQPVIPPNSALLQNLQAAYKAPTPPPQPGGFVPVPDAKIKQLPAAVSPARPAGPPAAPEPVLTPPSVPSAAAPQGPAAPTPVAPGAAPQIAPATPGGTNHNLSAVNTLIGSTASTIGNVLSTAVQAAAAAGTLGGSAAAGGIGAGTAGSLIAGGVQQIGKIGQDAANVVSSFLVGSVPGSFGGPPGSSPYGQPVRAEQNVPITAASRGAKHYTFNGMDIPKVFQELDLREAQDSQAEMAGYRG